MAGSPLWTVTLSNLAESLYRVQNRWGDVETSWRDGGLFKIGAPEKRVLALNLTSDDQGETLLGTVSYEAELATEQELRATRRRGNVYAVEVRQDGESAWLAHGQWLLGARRHQQIVALTVEADDDGAALTGKIAYAGEGPIQFIADRESSMASALRKQLDDVLDLEWITGRTAGMESAIVANERLLAESMHELRRAITGIDEDETNRARNHTRFEPLDPDFQLNQLLNLRTLSHVLNSFSRYTLYELMQQSLKNHQGNADDPVAPLHLFRQCFAQIAIDHAIIRQAVQQRRWNRDLADNYLRAHAVELLILDKLRDQGRGAFSAPAPRFLERDR